MIDTLDDFKQEMDKISKQGWITTHRSGTGGIGNTLENLLGIKENNLPEPDFGIYELKTSRDSSKSMLTLFTKSPKPLKVNSILLEKYGYKKDINSKKFLNCTLSADKPVKINKTGKFLKITCDDNKINLIGDDGFCEAYWEIEELEKTFNRKFDHSIIYVKSKTKGKGRNEQFLFYKAYELSGFDYNNFVELLKRGLIKIDIRIGINKDGKTHDHGTAFRIPLQYFDELFFKKEKIWENKERVELY